MHKLIAEMNVSEMPAIRKKLKVDMCIEKNMTHRGSMGDEWVFSVCSFSSTLYTVCGWHLTATNTSL